MVAITDVIPRVLGTRNKLEGTALIREAGGDLASGTELLNAGGSSQVRAS